MATLSLVPPKPVYWRVVLNNGKSFRVKAHTAFESDSRIYFTDIAGQEMVQALNSGKIVSHVIAAFDQEQVLYFAKENVVDTGPTSRTSRKKS